MKKADIFTELVATYRKHGWELKEVLVLPVTRPELNINELTSLNSDAVRDDTIDALWFSRPSHHKREAWELRLLSENQYALFETFEEDETEEQRKEMRQEMEARLREHVVAKPAKTQT
ncbi:MAG TPA: hypothetical protein VFD63_12150 [Pyrinomonadaceae bacterium]|nr:hypothetical protein [Pyrinomonadaceae bacterium]